LKRRDETSDPKIVCIIFIAIIHIIERFSVGVKMKVRIYVLHKGVEDSKWIDERMCDEENECDCL
jgi:hypothetical protein